MGKKPSPPVMWEFFILKWLLILILIAIVIGLFLPDDKPVKVELNPEPFEFYWDKAREKAIKNGNYDKYIRGRSNYSAKTPWPDIEPDVWIEMEKDGFNDEID